MNSFHKLLNVIIPVSFVLLLFPSFVNAYIDPGTGSYIFQVIIAAIVGASFAIKIYWRKIISFFKKVFTRR